MSLPILKPIPTIAQSLLDWYDKNHRLLPWRAPVGMRGDPYGVWVSEIMLQQTTVPTVKDYYVRFMEKWPTLGDFAACELEELLHLWQGLGYYSRARNMHACARRLMDDFGGQFPQDPQVLLTLPGIGPYTAAAIAAIAFEVSVAVVDGNVERVASRLFHIQTPLPQSKPEIRDHVQDITPHERSGDFAQAMMDLGSGVCTPTSPKCDLCPLQDHCEALGAGTVLTLPRKMPKAPKPVRHGWVLWWEDDGGRVVLERRPDKGLLAKMTGFPTSPWESKLPPLGDCLAPYGLEEPKLSDEFPLVKHVFTHFTLYLRIVRIHAPLPEKCLWATRETLHHYPLPTLMKKVAEKC